MKFKTKEIILVAIFATLTVVGSYIKIPIPPAPITMQIFFVALAGVLLGARLGGMSILVFMLLGLLGVPVFSEGGGLAYLFKPTFGYILGFVIGAYVIGKISELNKENSFKKYFFACLVGLAIVYAIGVPYLYYILKYVNGANVTFAAMLKSGMLIFLPGDILKLLLTASIAVKLVPRLKDAEIIK